MVTISTKIDNSLSWYLDTSCSTHKIGRRDWFVSLDESTKNKVKFVDDSTLKVKEVGKVLIKIKDGKQSFISYVLFMPRMKSNLLCLGQLLEKKDL